ncbi:hybrid sensor histidine kinase/response regulator [Paraburkholderia flagellata]|uniref:hybrid sensor histidine kinase/response regulator n=1 Tax=Paraburkholderia flagellata TaxID=2883241 RepID=UPI001F1968EA|nr:ATP-binding protein [Paraburkholderia flagellata]
MNPAPAVSTDPATLIALLNEDLCASRSLHELSLHLLVEHQPEALYSRIVEAARQLLGSDFASLQMLSGAEHGRERLDLIAYCGFTPAAAEHWRVVHIDSTTSCGAAWARGERVIVPDAEAWPEFAGTVDLDVFRETGIRSMQTTPLRARDGKLIGMLSTHWTLPYAPGARQLQLFDILASQAASLIERTKAEALLREREAKLAHVDRMKDHFLATLAHELRNPLAPIRNGLQILRASPDPRDGKHVLDMLDRQLGHLVRLVDDLMEVARINNGTIALRRRRIDIHTVLETALDLSRPAIENARHTLTVSEAAEPLHLHGDDVRLAQVFANLLNNAAKYTPEGGRIDIAVERGLERVVVTVADNGMGFTQEESPLLFTLFGRLHPERHTDGLGVGLALSKKLVELHGGTISAESDGRNLGSRFVVSLPVDRAFEQAAPNGAAAAAANLDGKKVLIVDDNRDAADSLGELLEVLGCECAVFYDGKTALDSLERTAPAIAFIDLDMPGLDGCQFARRVRARADLHGLYLVALTGWAQDKDTLRSAQAGFDRHLAKPVGLDQLTAVLASARA